MAAVKGTHFNGQFEVELKYRLSSKTKFLQTLSTIPHEVLIWENIDTDWYFDTPSHSLKREHKSLSIRETEPSGFKLWIAKGPEPERCEATDIANAKTAKSMLKTLGYDVVLVVQKIRSIYFIGPYHVTLDYIEGLGYFSEFAIMTHNVAKFAFYKQELEALALRFGLGNEHLEHQSYQTLIANQQSSVSVRCQQGATETTSTALAMRAAEPALLYPKP